MYKLPYFTEPDRSNVIAFMRKNTFAVIAAMGHEYPVATQVPLDIKDEKEMIILTGHMMKGTDHHKALENNSNALVIFTGPQCYVSASWYTKPEIASTWNYISVQVKGKIRFENEEGTRKIVENITNHYEDSESSARFEALPVDYVNRLVKAIIGFTIEVESMENVFKLSQNHHAETRKSIIDHLHKRGDDNSVFIAEEMEKRMSL